MVTEEYNIVYVVMGTGVVRKLSTFDLVDGLVCIIYNARAHAFVQQYNVHEENNVHVWRFTAFSKSHADRIYCCIYRCSGKSTRTIRLPMHVHTETNPCSAESRGEKENFDSLIQYYMVHNNIIPAYTV
ncbi:hypothetical protein QTP88_009234 [Uroleucon formosanum]